MPHDFIVPDYRVVYTFPDEKTRMVFCEGKYLELIGAREDFMDSNQDLHLSVQNQSKSRIAACNTAAELYGAEIYHTCGGGCMDDCCGHQNLHGKTCSYCDYIEMRVLTS